jgi:hypothetical protein
VKRGTVALAAVLAVLAASAAPSPASQLLDRGVRTASLAVNDKGEALITYRNASGKDRHVLAWGAVNAIPPAPGKQQVHFDLDYSGGWGKYHQLYWKTFRNACRPYDGPALAYVVAACKAPDGSYWALQSWDAFWPDLGFTPWKASQADVLTLSHWTGDPAVLDVHSDWAYGGKARQLFGTFSYAGKPVYGFKSTHYGAPVDSFGRLVYVDTFSAPAYGPGWRRENSFLAQTGTGGFCYAFAKINPLTGGYAYPPGYKAGLRGPGISSAYRVSAEGPGVTPDVAVTIKDPGTWNPKDAAKVRLEQEANALVASLKVANCSTS